MMDQRLRRILDRVDRRCRLVRSCQWLTALWGAAAVLTAGLWYLQVDRHLVLAYAVPTLGLTTAVLCGVTLVMLRRVPRRDQELAQRIEALYPDLGSRLRTALEQVPTVPGGRLGYLQRRVVQEALEHAQRRDWRQIVSPGRLRSTLGIQFASLASFLVLLTGLALADRPPSSARSSPASVVDVAADSSPTHWLVEPGDVEVEQGSSLPVLARAQGRVPLTATLLYQTSAGVTAEIPLSASLGEPVFGARIPLVDEPLEYRITSEQGDSAAYRVKVFTYPRLERADAHLEYPAYTQLPARDLEDIRSLTAVRGTRLQLRCRLNKPVATAVLVSASGDAPDSEPLALTATPADPTMYVVTLTLTESRRLRLELTDDAGRGSAKPYTFRFQVLPNQLATIKPKQPGRDTEVSALEEIDLAAEMQDDFGLQRYGLAFTLGDGGAVEIILGQQIAGRQRIDARHLLALEELSAQPDQLLSYYWWAEDFDDDGQVRRSESDLYFAEVRPFEEIFRQGETPPGGQQQRSPRQSQQSGGQGQNAQDAQQLAQLQKDIINATWKLLRRTVEEKRAEAFAADLEQVRLSQDAARQQAASLAERITDAQAQEHVATVLEQMSRASEQLSAAQQDAYRLPLNDALRSEQAAYQGLLRLRAREHEVVRQQQNSSSSSASASSAARSQQQRAQLQQLNLRDEENRYEQQRSAAEQQAETQEERENRQILNRLRELARRQHDLNERLKELQTALEAAADPQQREEVRRQLQRLQDEQRQIMQDTDELRDRMDQPENQQRMTEERQQLEETREQVRRSSEALRQERVSQAAASGTRAENQLDELRDEFRRRAAQRFTEEMREMRDAARQLDDTQRQLAEQMQELETPPMPATPSLRDDNRKEAVADALEQQRQRLSTLQEQMRDTIERAETTEPILSQRLYDSARNLRDQSLDRALQETERALRQGQLGQAQQREPEARTGLRELREGIERAASGVLGDETEALRRAREELRSLSRELNEEIQRESPDAQSDDERGQGERGQRERGQGARGQGERGQGERGQGERGQGERGQGERGQGERGQGERGQGERGQGERGQGERGQGERGQGERGQGEQGQGERGQGERGQGERGQGERGQGERGQGERGQGERGQGERGQGERGQGERGQGERGQGERGQGERGQGERGQGERGQGERGQGERGQGERGQGERGQGERGQDGEGQRGGNRGPSGERSGTVGEFAGEGGMVGPGTAPLTGEGFRQWSDRLRDVEEMVEAPELRAEAARIRERARELRVEMKRHSAPPNWDLVREQISRPLAELESRVGEELLRRTSRQATTPLDRDPVPPRYQERTRRYYERLGSGQ
ncbi:MAG: hypothetical protein U0935_10520 [Pirellulales bacterium]